MRRPSDYDWSDPARTALLRRLYLDEALCAGQIAERLTDAYGQPAHARTVSRRVAHLGLASERTQATVLAQRAAHNARARASWRGTMTARVRFYWTDERVATLKRLYLNTAQSGEEIAQAIAPGCTARAVAVKVHRLGLAAERPRALSLARRRAITVAMLAAPRPTGPRVRPPPPPKPPVVDPGDRALIDAALAAGRVTYCPPGLAGGLSRMEQLLGVVVKPADSPVVVAARGRAGPRGRLQIELRRTAA